MGLHALFKVLAVSMSSELNRYYLNGVCLEKIGDEVNFISTDGHRLTYINALANEYCQFTAAEMGADNFSFIMPRDAIQEFLKTGKFLSDFIQLELNKKTVSFTFGAGDVIKTYKLIDGTFPDWRKVIPKNIGRIASFNAQYLKQLCSTLSGEALTLNAEIITPKKGTKKKVLIANYSSHNPFTATNNKGANFVIMPMRG